MLLWNHDIAYYSLLGGVCFKSWFIIPRDVVYENVIIGKLFLGISKICLVNFSYFVYYFLNSKLISYNGGYKVTSIIPMRT